MEHPVDLLPGASAQTSAVRTSDLEEVPLDNLGTGPVLN
jgi:hypothetical protein